MMYVDGGNYSARQRARCVRSSENIYRLFASEEILSKCSTLASMSEITILALLVNFDMNFVT